MTLVVYGATACAAVLAGRHAFGDAANFLVKIATNGQVTHFYENWLREFYYSRVVAFHITQLPAVAWVNFGNATVEQMSLIYGATLWGLKIASLAISYRFLAPADKPLFVFPLLTLVAGSINIDLYIVSESHVMIAFFWPVLIALTTTRPPTPGRCAYVIASALLMLFTYESALFFGAILGIVAVRAGLATAGRYRIVYLFAAALFFLGAVFALVAVANPRDLTNRTAFLAGLLGILPTSVYDLIRVPLGPTYSIAVLVLVGLATLAQMMSRDPGRKISTAILWLAAIGGVALVLQALLADATLQVATAAIRARILNLVMPLAFAIAYLVALELRRLRAVSPEASALGAGQYRLLAGVAAIALLAQAAYQNILTARWVEATATISRAIAKEPGGPIAFEEVIQDLPPRKAARITALVGDWWIQPLSVLLARDKHLRSVVIFGPGHADVFRPFDPWSPAHIPTLEKLGWDRSEYVARLGSARKLDPEASLDFRAGGNGWRFVKRGLSQPEPWGTWSDAGEVQLEIPGPFSQGDLAFSLELRPYLPLPDSKVVVTALAGGEDVATWPFTPGAQDRTVDLRIPARLVPKNVPLSLTFRIMGARSPASLGISADPRALGIGLIRMRQIREG